MIYEGLNDETRVVVDSRYEPEEGCNLFEQFARKSFEWDMTKYVTPTLENSSMYASQTNTSMYGYCSCYCYG